MLRMMEPELEEDFKPGQKKRVGSREMLEEQKMRHKLKQVQILSKYLSFGFNLWFLSRREKVRGKKSGLTMHSLQHREPSWQERRMLIGRRRPRPSSRALPVKRGITRNC